MSGLRDRGCKRRGPHARSRVATGSVGRNVEVNDDDLGFIASDELNPQKSRILLALALLKPRPLEEVQRLFSTY
jgi:L-asparaginase